MYKIPPGGGGGSIASSRPIGLYREKHEKSSCLKPQGLEPCYLVCIIIWWTSTKFVQIITLGPKISPPGVHMFYIGLYKEQCEKTFLSETTRPRALIFGM